MLSFKKFLSERKVDPLELTKRVARRFGRGNEHTDEYEDVKKHQHIPLSKYNEDDAENAELAYFKRVHPIVNDRQKFESSFAQKEFNISDLHPTQPFVRTEDDKITADKISNGGKVRVATHNGKHFVMDGHHTIMAARARGDKKIIASHINLDK